MYKLNLSRLPSIMMLTVCGVILSACSSTGEERPEHLDAASTRQLEIPPMLTQPDTSGALRLPQPSQQALARANGKAEQNDQLPEFSGLRLQNEQQLYWLEIDSPVEQVWASIPEFLAAEGITVQRQDRGLGFIETEWLNDYPISYGTDKKEGSWFASFSPDYKDKFRLRVEAKNQDQTLLYVSHRGMQISVNSDVSEWVQRNSEALLEREIMYRYILYAGALKSQATQLLAGYQSYQPRVIENPDELQKFEVQGSAKIVWLRLRAAMDRLGVDVIESDAAARTLTVKVGSLKVSKTAKASGSWFSGLFGRDVAVEDEDVFSEKKEFKPSVVKEEDKIDIKIMQQAQALSSSIIIQPLKASAELTGIALDFRNALVNQLN